MNKQAITLGRIFGISIRLDYSWFLIFALVTWTLAAAYYPFELVGWPTATYWILAAVTALAFFASVLLHELGHSVVAMRFRIPVRRITLFIFGGVAEIGSEPPSALAEFLIAIAGPLVSFALAGAFAVVEAVSGGLAPLFVVAEYLALINGTLALFNLVPGFPLDGGRVFRAIVWGITGNMSRATRIAATLGRVVGFLFIAFGVWQVFTGDLTGLWIGFIGWYLQGIAAQQLEQQSVHDVLARHWVSEAMDRNYGIVPAEITLQQLGDRYLGSGQQSFVVEHDGAVVGFLSVNQLRSVPRAQWFATTAAQAMIPAARIKALRPDADLWQAVEEMGRDGTDPLAVISDGRTWGMLSREDVNRFLRRLRQVTA